MVSLIKAVSRCGVLLTCLLSGVHPAGAATEVFTATFEVGTCDVEFDQSGTIALATPVVGDILGKSWAVTGAKPVTFQVSCVGLSSGTPAVTLSSSDNVKDMNTPADKGFIVRVDDSSLFGIGFFRGENTTKSNLWRLQGYGTDTGDGDYDITATTFPATMTMTAALMCGDTSDCNSAQANPGNVSATVTLGFEYH